MDSQHELIRVEGGVPIKAWVRGVPLDEGAREQLQNVARLPIVHGWVAVMPDVHFGIGATVGSVIPTEHAIIPAAVGVDIGCGMIAVKTSLKASDLPDNLGRLRTAIERAVPHGRTNRGGKGDRGAWGSAPPTVQAEWQRLAPGYDQIVRKHPKLDRGETFSQLGTLGGGNHFIEVCLDESESVWLMLHSGSRGVGNRIGSYFIELAKRLMEKQAGSLPDRNLAWLSEGTPEFDDYVHAVGWAQDYARTNRKLMMGALVQAVRKSDVPPFSADLIAVNCHHNYVAKERHRGRDLLITRKGAVHAGKGVLGIIPGSMGTRSYIVRGLGNPESFESCSHGAGRLMSRTEAKRRFSLEDHDKAMTGIEARRDKDVIDETPMAYKSIEAVMAAQSDLVAIEHALRQVLVVKG